MEVLKKNSVFGQFSVNFPPPRPLQNANFINIVVSASLTFCRIPTGKRTKFDKKTPVYNKLTRGAIYKPPCVQPMNNLFFLKCAKIPFTLAMAKTKTMVLVFGFSFPFSDGFQGKRGFSFGKKWF